MAVSESSRPRLYRLLNEAIGSEAADALMTYLPTTTTADEQVTKGDVAAVKADVAALEQRLADTKEVLLARIGESEQRVIAVFRGELVQAVSGQTRMMIFTMAGAVVSVGGFALALARLG